MSDDRETRSIAVVSLVDKIDNVVHETGCYLIIDVEYTAGGVYLPEGDRIYGRIHGRPFSSEEEAWANVSRELRCANERIDEYRIIPRKMYLSVDALQWTAAEPPKFETYPVVGRHHNVWSCINDVD